jgi:hypothetical protein
MQAAKACAIKHSARIGIDISDINVLLLQNGV